MLLLGVGILAAFAASTSAQTARLGPSSFTAPGAFPTSVYKHYFNNPTQTSAQVQPIITDPVTHKAYPFDLTNPDTIPQVNIKDPHLLPPKASNKIILAQALAQIQSIANPNTPGSPFADNACAQCQAALGVGKFVALAAPTQGPAVVVAICNAFRLSGTCETTFGPLALGGVVTQVLAAADVAGYDGQLICQNFASACPLPPTSSLNLTNWFEKPKPKPLPKPKKPSGKRLKVLHMSDFHIDPRFATGAEANCTSGLCCRANAFNSASPNSTLFPAPRFGAFLCDTPFALALSALQAIPVLAGTQRSGFDFTVYTGDLVSHDTENQLSRDYVMYTETVLYDLFRRMLGSGPVYAALGNHDSYNQAQDAPHSLGGAQATQFSWNYNHVAELWKHEKWLPQAAVDLAKAHYSAYMVRRKDGLRIITLNTDFWYRANWFNYINLTSADTSGMLRFLTDELQDAEDAGDRVWILGHVLSGWDGTNALENPTNLFYQIVERFSPHVIANIFWGHTHEDELSIFYANNGTDQSPDAALAVSWIGPAVTPLTNLNSGFRVYEVDSSTFDIVDAFTWKSDVDSFHVLDNQTTNGPAYSFEYNTRETYGKTISNWGPNDPLNATWWHLVTEAMMNDSSLVDLENTFQGKSSARTQPCIGNCTVARICYMRSGSSSIAKQNCIPGFGSVQGG